jgi:hypothetical protein
MLDGWFRDSFEELIAGEVESMSHFSVSASEVSTGTVTRETLSNFGNASGASVSNKILSKGIYDKYKCNSLLNPCEMEWCIIDLTYPLPGKKEITYLLL